MENMLGHKLVIIRDNYFQQIQVKVDVRLIVADSLQLQNYTEPANAPVQQWVFLNSLASMLYSLVLHV